MFKTRFISILALLCLTAVTGAWAQEETLLTTILSTGDNASFKSGSKTFDNIATVTFSGNVYNDGDDWGWYSDEGTLTVTAAEGYTITRVKFYANTNSGFDEEAPFEAILEEGRAYITKVNGTSIGSWGVTKIEVYGYANPTVAVTGVTLAPTTATLTLGETETVTLTATVLPNDATDKSVTWSSSNEAVATVADGVVTAVAAGTATITVTTTDGAKTATCAVTVAAPAASTYTVTLKEGTDDADNWTITPAEATTTGVAAGTEVKATYGGTKKVKSVKAVKKAKPAATVTTAPTAKTGVKAGEDVAIVNAGTAEGGTMMYAVTTTNTKPTSTEGFSADVPTAEGLTEACTRYVWYYVKADDSHTDSEISASGIEVTIEAAGLTYPIALGDATSDYVGSVVTTDGNVYATVAAASAASKTAVAVIAYVGTAGSVDASSDTYKGLAVALSDANSGSNCQWATDIANCLSSSQTGDIVTALGFKNGITCTSTLTGDGHTHAAATAAASNNGTTAPTGTSGWFMPSMGQWNLIVQGLATKKAGSAVTTDLTYQTDNPTYKADNLNSVITAAGGTGFQKSSYWASTEQTLVRAWTIYFTNGYATNYAKAVNYYVRSIIAF